MPSLLEVSDNRGAEMAKDDEILAELNHVVGLATALTNTQFQDLQDVRGLFNDGAVRLWLAVFKQVIKDFEAYKLDPNSYNKRRDAKDLENWLDSKSLSMDMITDIFAQAYNIDEDVFRDGLRRYMKGESIASIKRKP